MRSRYQRYRRPFRQCLFDYLPLLRHPSILPVRCDLLRVCVHHLSKWTLSLVSTSRACLLFTPPSRRPLPYAYEVRRFHDEEDLRQQLRDWHREVNEERPCRATGIIPALRLAEEAPRLRTLKVQPEQLALRIPVYVGPTGTVLHDGHAYSMPPEA